MKNLIILFSLLCFKTAYSQTWNTVGGGMDSMTNGVNTFFVWNDTLIVGGGFGSVAGGTIPSEGLAYWDSSNWSSGNTDFFSGSPKCFTKFNSDLYIGGQFIKINNNSYCRGIAKRDGVLWQPLGKGINNGLGLRAMAEYNGSLYVGGQFTLVDSSISAKRIARWDGNQWYAMGTGFTSAFGIFSMQVFNNELYIAGDFSAIDGLSANNICRWNGTNWDSLTSGVYGVVRCMTVDTINNILYVGGSFTYAGGSSIPTGVAAWDGSTWSAVGTTPFLSPVAMCMYQSKLFIGGAQYNITNNLGDTIQELAWFNGTEWMPACYQIDFGEVEAMTVYKTELYIGGYFDHINDSIVFQIARTYFPTVGVDEFTNEEAEISISPNPFTSSLSITLQKQNIKQATFTIKNILGQTVYKNQLATGNRQSAIKLDLSFLSKGIYLLEVIVDPEKNGTGGERMVRKIVKE